MKRTYILHIHLPFRFELRKLRIEAIPGPIRHPPTCALRVTRSILWPSGTYPHGTAVIATRYVFFFTQKKKKTFCTTLCCVVFTVFVALLSRAIKASAEVACADEMMTRCCICTRRRKTKEVEVKLESSTAQQPTAIPAGHVERPPWIPIGNSSRVAGKMLTGRLKKRRITGNEEGQKKEAFFFFLLLSALNGRFRPSTLVSRNHRDGDPNFPLEAVPLFCFRVVGRAWRTFRHLWRFNNGGGWNPLS